MFVLLAEEPVEDVEARGPEALVEGQPLVRGLERSGVEATEMGASANLTLDQPRAFQDFDVLRSRSERHRKGLRKLADRPLARGEFDQHAPARRIAQRVEDGGKLWGQQFNHVVEYRLVIFECQPFG